MSMKRTLGNLGREFGVEAVKTNVHLALPSS